MQCIGLTDAGSAEIRDMTKYSSEASQRKGKLPARAWHVLELTSNVVNSVIHKPHFYLGSECDVMYCKDAKFNNS